MCTMKRFWESGLRPVGPSILFTQWLPNVYQMSLIRSVRVCVCMSVCLSLQAQVKGWGCESLKVIKIRLKCIVERCMASIQCDIS